MSQLCKGPFNPSKPGEDRLLILLQFHIGLMGQFPESMCMDQSLPLMTNQLFFIGQQTGLLDLLRLKPQHVFKSCTIDTFMLQGIQLRAKILPCLVGLLIPPT